MKTKTVIVSPFSRPVPRGENAKNYPYWSDVISQLSEWGVRTIQIGEKGEPEIGATEKLFGLPLNFLAELVRLCDTWVSVDNFFHHFCALHKKPGVVIFGKSDPLIFGHAENCNLLKGREFLRPHQFRFWSQEPHDERVFVSPDRVCSALARLLLGDKNQS
jgi:ADP-heptose:LPS heptosyltransferase